jgi:PAS domain S-box-containing protein
MFEDSPNPMWVYDVETLRFLAVNDAAIHHYGYARDEFLSMTLIDIRRPEDVPALLEGLPAIETPKFTRSGDFKHRKKDGTLIEMRIESHELSHSGRAARVVLATDVTNQKRAEEALWQHQERTRFALDAGRIGVWDHDAATGVATWSDMLQRIHGLVPGTFAGTMDAFIQLVDPDDRSAVLGELGRALNEATDSNIEYRTIWPDGTTHWIAGKGRFFRNDADAITGGVGVGIDVTEHRQLEVQLAQSQKMEAVGQLAGGIAHDFNNMLTAILGYAELLVPALTGKEGCLNDLEQIRKSAMRATHLTRQLLAFSRKQILQPVVVDLNGLIQELANLLRRLINEDVELKLALDPKLGRIKADPGQIEQVIMNLAINARDAMPGGGCLTIETANIDVDDEFFRRHGFKREVEGDRFVVLMVSDTGVGMDAETKKRIFEPFFTTKAKGKGTGLGLATVYGIVKQSGGSIWVYSEPGRGATFKVYLPRTDEAIIPEAAGAVSGGSLRGTETILLVEDEEAVRLLSRALLERCGYRVIEAVDAEQAIQLADRTARIDLLLTDVVMPGWSGPDLFEHLRPSRPEMKVLYMSGYTDEAIVKRGVLAPGTLFIQKPFTAFGLTQKVREVLSTDKGPPA